MVLAVQHLPARKCLNATSWWEAQLDEPYGLGMNSQLDQDARLVSLFSEEHLGTTNRFYVEFGFTGCDNSQTERLRKLARFRGLRFDSKCPQPKTHGCLKEWIDPRTIVETFERHKSPKEPDYVSIDIDSTDAWVFGNLTKTIRPRVLTVEYRSNKPLDEIFESDQGSSLGAIIQQAKRSGYSVVGVEPSLDAFLVRSDLVCPGSEVNPQKLAQFTGLERPHVGMPRDRRRRGCYAVGICQVNWTLRQFPCNSTRDEFCTGHA